MSSSDIYITGEIGTFVPPSLETAANGQLGAVGEAAAPPVDRDLEPDGGGSRVEMDGWEAAVEKPRSLSRPATTNRVQVGQSSLSNT